MTPTSTMKISSGRRSVGELDPDRRTLAGEHAVLLRDVGRRVSPVLALADAGRWPAAELDTLVRFLRRAVLRQASDEEVVLYPHRSAAPFAELSADHVRLHALTDRLEAAVAQPRPLPEVRGLLEELLAVLERHLRDEQEILAAMPAAPEVPSVADILAGTRSWPIADEQSVLVMLDAWPAERAVRSAIERLLRLRTGETAEVRSSDGSQITRVADWMRRFDPVGYGLARLGDGTHALRVTRRPR